MPGFAVEYILGGLLAGFLLGLPMGATFLYALQRYLVSRLSRRGSKT